MQKTVIRSGFSTMIQYHYTLFFCNRHHYNRTNYFPPVVPFANIYPCMLLICSGLWTDGFAVWPVTNLFLPLEKALTFSLPLSELQKVTIAIRCICYITNSLTTLGWQCCFWTSHHVTVSSGKHPLYSSNSTLFSFSAPFW